MIELHYWPTPNGQKIAVFLEETGLEWEAHAVNISKNDQFKPEFLAFSPNNRIPAIIDKAPKDGGQPITVFESGAILTYLADKIGKFIPTDVRGRVRTLEWLFWQVGGLGPMAGQNGHFANAAEKIPYAIDRYVKETARLYGVMNTQLGKFDYLAGDYSIADMAAYPWVVPHAMHSQKLEDFPHLQRWFEAIKARPAVVRAYEKGAILRKG